MSEEGVNSLFAGIMGAGKTFAVLHELKREERVLVYDQSGFLFEEKQRFGGEVTKVASRVSDVLNQADADGMGFRIGFVDQSGAHEQWFFEQVKKLTEPPEGGFPDNKVTLWIEEAAFVFHQSDNPERLHPIMLELMRGSRHRRLNIIFATQRPQDLPRKMRDLLNDFWIFRLPDVDAADVGATKLGDRKLSPKIQVLGNGFHYKRNVKGERIGPVRIKA